jgi:hypothetical protein
MNNNQKIDIHRIVAYTHADDGTMEIVQYVRTWGISKTNKIYNRERKMMAIRMNKNGFFFLNGPLIRPFTIKHLENFIASHIIRQFLIENVPFVELMIKHDLMKHRTFNYIIKNKLTSLKKMIADEYKLPYTVCKKIIDASLTMGYTQFHHLELIKFNLTHHADHIQNMQKINMGMFTNNNYFTMFIDTIKMARTLDKKVNAAWSFNRLKEEHDEMAVIITDITLTAEDRDLYIRKIFTEFAEYSNFHLITRTKELALEGKRQNHCVSSYTSKIDLGKCAIYRVENYTLELEPNGSGIKVAQFRGYGNASAPSELVERVFTMIKEFNQSKGTLIADTPNAALAPVRVVDNLDDLLF